MSTLVGLGRYRRIEWSESSGNDGGWNHDSEMDTGKIQPGDYCNAPWTPMHLYGATVLLRRSRSCGGHLIQILCPMYIALVSIPLLHEHSYVLCFTINEKVARIGFRSKCQVVILEVSKGVL